MADIFISYTKKDRSRVEPLALALEKNGWSIWWDPIIPTGGDFDDIIEEELSKARCVIVIWSKRSVKSKYVKGEAREALSRGILVPIEIESGIKPSFDFRSIQTLSLIDWDGSENYPGFKKLIADVIRILSGPMIREEKRSRRDFDPKRKAEDERGPEAAVQLAKVKTNDKPAEEKSSNTVSIERVIKRLAFGTGAIILIAVLIGIGLFLKSDHEEKKADQRKSDLKKTDPSTEYLESELSKIIDEIRTSDSRLSAPEVIDSAKKGADLCRVLGKNAPDVDCMFMQLVISFAEIESFVKKIDVASLLSRVNFTDGTATSDEIKAVQKIGESLIETKSLVDRIMAYGEDYRLVSDPGLVEYYCRNAKMAFDYHDSKTALFMTKVRELQTNFPSSAPGFVITLDGLRKIREIKKEAMRFCH